MQSRSLIIAFLPLIAFSLLSRVLPQGAIGVAGLVAAGAGIGVVIGLIILALIPIMPFTEQFAVGH